MGAATQDRAVPGDAGPALAASLSAAPPAEQSLAKAPKWPRDGAWLNGRSSSGKIYSGKVSLIYFWDYTSINCLREIPLLKRLDETYHPYGFQLIWVHAPEFSFAKQKENIQKAVGRLKITQPVFLDNDFKLWEAFENRSWPTKYLIDEDGRILQSWVGEGRDQEAEYKIRLVLQGMKPQTVLPGFVMRGERELFDPKTCGYMTGETYLGHKRAGWWGGQIANRQWMEPENTMFFKDEGKRVERGFFAQGLWQNREDDFKHARETFGLDDYLGLNYIAHEVYVVAHQTNEKGLSRVYVTRDGEPIPPAYRGLDLREDPEGTYFLIAEPRLYYLIQNDTQELHELRLWTPSEGVAINSFSFANLCLSDLDMS